MNKDRIAALDSIQEMQQQISRDEIEARTAVRKAREDRMRKKSPKYNAKLADWKEKRET